MRTNQRGEHGFSLTELVLVVSIMLIIAGMTIGGVPSMLKTAKADGSLAELSAAMRFARESAISNRRNVRVTFGTNTITATRVEYCPSVCTTTSGPNQYSNFVGCSSTCTANTTTLRTFTLEGRADFRLVSGLPDTPDAFGMASATALGSYLPAMFTTDGSFINSQGDVLNGTLFIAIPTDRNSARAITVFGPTGAMRLWRWDGRRWIEV
jgi:prepilin-type N-terminal cleavage/methylation domain-containing protein